MTNPQEAVRRLAVIERVLGPQIEQATAALDAAAAGERAQLLAERERELAEREKAATVAADAHLGAVARAAKAAAANRVAQQAAAHTWSARWSASCAADRSRTVWDQRLAEFGLRQIDDATARLRGMAAHARTSVRFVPVVRPGAAGFYPTGKTEMATPSALEAVRACEQAVAEVDALRYDASVSPATIEAHCRAAVERCLAAGGAELWRSYARWSVDMAPFVEWLARTSPEAALALNGE